MQVLYTYTKTLCLCISVFILTGCAWADIHYPVEIPQGLVRIFPDRSEYALPVLEYHFYNMDTSQEYMICTSDGSGNFEGVIPVGTYRVIATNTSAANVEFTDMDSHATATAVAASQVRAVNAYIGQPAEVYNVVVDEVIVSGEDMLPYRPSPGLLTRTLTLRFLLSDELQRQVSALSGVFPGVFPSVHLYSGKTSASEVMRSPDVFTTYSGARNDAGWVAPVRLFGLCDPQHGAVYHCITNITLMVGDVPFTLDVDLTDAVSSIMEAHSGELPADVPIQLHIELRHIDLEVVGRVESWSYVTDDGTEILIPV